MLNGHILVLQITPQRQPSSNTGGHKTRGLFLHKYPFESRSTPSAPSNTANLFLIDD